MKKTHQLRRIKTKKSYSSIELADLLGVHVQTVRGWANNGLTPLSPEAHRPLFLGQTVKSYLTHLQNARKVKLQEGEFYCLRCRVAVTPESVKEVNRHVTIGKHKDSILLTAHCPKNAIAKSTSFLADYQLHRKENMLLTHKRYVVSGDWYQPKAELFSKPSVVLAEYQETSSSSGDWSGYFLQKIGQAYHLIAFTQENLYPEDGFELVTGDVVHTFKSEPNKSDVEKVIISVLEHSRNHSLSNNAELKGSQC